MAYQNMPVPRLSRVEGPGSPDLPWLRPQLPVATGVPTGSDQSQSRWRKTAYSEPDSTAMRPMLTHTPEGCPNPG